MVSLFLKTPKSPRGSLSTNSFPPHIRCVSGESEVRVAMANGFRCMCDIIYPPGQLCPRRGGKGHNGIKISLAFTECTNFVKLQMPVMHFCKFLCWKTRNKEVYDLSNTTDSSCPLVEQIFTSRFDFTALDSVRVTIIVILLSTKPKKSIFCWDWSTDFTGCTVKPSVVNKVTVSITFC